MNVTMSLHLSAPVHVFASRLVDVSPPQLLLLLPELLCLLSLGWKKTSQLENIHHSCLSVYLSHRHYICSSSRVKTKKKESTKNTYMLLKLLQFASPLLLLCLSDTSHLEQRLQSTNIQSFEKRNCCKCVFGFWFFKSTPYPLLSLLFSGCRIRST